MNYLSSKFNFERGENDLSKLLSVKKNQTSFLDLTSSNPTSLFSYDTESILSAFQNPLIASYQPDPQGLMEARLAIVEYYNSKGRRLLADQIFLTSGTSEAMSFILKAVCDSDSEILLPTPGYPLYDFLLVLENVKSSHYTLVSSAGENQHSLNWEIQFELLEKKITPNTKAIVLVEPNNPTGSRLSNQDATKLVSLCLEKNLILIVDEVFSDYYDSYYATQPFCDANCIFLNGISKTLALPQMKLSWMYLSGNSEFVKQMKEALEIITDSYLSVNIPVQLGLRKLLETSNQIQSQIKQRIQKNCLQIQTLLETEDRITYILPKGGWYMLLKIKTRLDDERFACELLETQSVYVYPGYMFDLENECFTVISLIVPEEILQEGIKRIIRFLQD